MAQLRGLRTLPSFSAGRARAAGISEQQLRSVRRISHGWYTFREVRSLRDLCEALLELLPDGAYFSYYTALKLYNLPIPLRTRSDEDPIHISISRESKRTRRRGIVVHRHDSRETDVATLDGLPVATPQRVYIDVAAGLKRDELAVIGDAMLGKKLTTIKDLEERLRSARRRRGLALARATIPLLDGGSQSPPESVLRLKLYDAGLVMRTQCPVYSLSGALIGHADLGHPEMKVAVEYDGRHHAKEKQFRYDTRRYTAFAAAGWQLLRASADDYRTQFRDFVKQVCDAVAESRRRKGVATL